MKDFEYAVKRRNKGAAKYRVLEENNAKEGVLPLSVADMEFRTPKPIIDHLKDYLSDDIVLGYTEPTAEYYDIVTKWMKEKHDMDVEKEWIVTAPGVVVGYTLSYLAVTNPGDGILIMNPVYPPFAGTIQNNERTLIHCPLLKDEDGYYEIDFDEFELLAKRLETKVVLFCNPHNPVGRVWKKEELEKVVKIAMDNDCIIISDEIWSDIIMPGFQFTSMLNIDDPRLKDRLVVGTAASKTFNIAGLACSNIIIPNEEIRNGVLYLLKEKYHIGVNVLGLEATKAAYDKGEAWRKEMLSIIDTNQRLMHSFFKENFPQIKCPLIEGTYVCWVDFSALGWTDQELTERMKKHDIYVNDGYTFGGNGSQFLRFNIALPTKNLEEALQRVKEAIEKG